MIKPPALKPGDTIGIFAPSSRIADRDSFTSALNRLENYGYKIFVHPQTWLADGQAAGDGRQKAQALHDLLRDDNIAAIICGRGGNRALTMLEHLDFELIRQHPKIIVGYSDVTALSNALHALTGVVGFHGPMIYRLFEGLPEAQLKQTLEVLMGAVTSIPLPATGVMNPGDVHGPLLGGNLSVLCSLLGTPFAPNFKGAILFLEDVGDELSRLDRYFLQLRNAGILHEICGLLVGGFTDLKDTGSLPFGCTMPEIIVNAMAGIDIPIVLNAPFGHGADLYTFPVGGQARLDLNGPAPMLTLDAAARAP